MKQEPEIKAFKNELKNYKFYLERVKKLESLIDYCYDMLPGSVHGLNPAKETTHGAPNKEFEYKIRDEISHHEQNKARTQAKIDSIREILDLIENDTRTAIMRVCVDGESYERVSRDMYLSPTGLKKRVNKALKKALN